MPVCPNCRFEPKRQDPVEGSVDAEGETVVEHILEAAPGSQSQAEACATPALIGAPGDAHQHSGNHNQLSLQKGLQADGRDVLNQRHRSLGWSCSAAKVAATRWNWLYVSGDPRRHT